MLRLGAHGLGKVAVHLVAGSILLVMWGDRKVRGWWR